MTLVDVNLLLYAYDPDAPQHTAALSWLEELFNGLDAIGLCWPVIWAFLRISTNSRIRPGGKTANSAFRIVRQWLTQPGVVVIQPGLRYLELLEQLVIEGQATGPLVSDAVLAALAIENGATLASTDKDFSRFTGLHWVNPLAK